MANLALAQTSWQPGFSAAHPAAAAARPACEGRCFHARRLMLLIFAIMLMSAADLFCTMTYMSSVGMLEVNPIARFMVSVGSAQQLVLFKLFTIALSCGALYLARRNPLSERVAWLCAAGLLALMLHWTAYNSSVSELTNEITTLALHGGHDWWIRF